MRDWMDFNGDEEIDGAERMFAEEMLLQGGCCDNRRVYAVIVICIHHI